MRPPGDAPVVVDASVALAWVLPGEGTDAALALRNRAADAPALRILAPPCFWYEVANVLWAAVRRGRLRRAEAEEALASLRAFSVETWSVAPEGCLALAFQHGLAVYDSSYLELAAESGAVLWSLDEALRAAARAVGIRVEP